MDLSTSRKFASVLNETSGGEQLTRNRQMMDQLEILAITIISAVVLAILFYEWQWGGMNDRNK